MKRLVYLLLSLLLLPVAGLVLSNAVLQDFAGSRQYAGNLASCDQASPGWKTQLVMPTFSFYHGQNLLDTGKRLGEPLQQDCQQFLQAVQLRQYSQVLAGIAILFPLVFWLVALIAKAGKRSMVLVFPKLVKLSLFFLALLMMGHGLVVVQGADLLQGFYLETNRVWVSLFLVIGALSVVFTLLRVFWQVNRQEDHFIFGKALAEQDYPKVYKVVALLADKLGAKKPDNIVVGFEPNFFVTSQKVQVFIGEDLLQGTTLYLSLPLCRLLSLPEIITIIGHELGHFRQGDTDYTLKFAPVYRGLGQSLINLHDEDGSLSFWSMIPANMLFFMRDIFLKAEGRMSRTREFSADRAAMEVASPEALASSLMKLSLYSFLWDEAIEENSLRLERGLFTRNLSLAFANIVRYDVAHDKALMSIDEMLEAEISHPTDSHPTTAERILAVSGGHMPSFEVSDLKIPEQPAITVFDHYQELEEELTEIEHYFAIELKDIVLPEEDDEEFRNLVLKAVYYVICELITIDDEIHENEIDVAEHIALHIIPGFEPVDFREACHHPEDYGDVFGLAELLGGVLSKDGRSHFIEMLSKIANADAQYLEIEHDYIAKIQAIFDNQAIAGAGGEGNSVT